MKEELREKISNIINGTILYGTIISDAYIFEEREEISKALKKVCNKETCYSFDSYGVYFYWDYATKEILYIGSTNNLTRRFKEHNGLVKNKSGNKYEKIKEYFNKKEKMGFSILVQSPLEQKDTCLPDKHEEVGTIESSLIEFYKQKYKIIPIWNDTEALKLGRIDQKVKRYATKIFESISLKEINDFNAKSTLREIANSDEILEFESHLHTFRMRMYKYEESFEIAKKNLLIPNPAFPLYSKFIISELENVLKSEYMNKKLII